MELIALIVIGVIIYASTAESRAKKKQQQRINADLEAQVREQALREARANPQVRDIQEWLFKR